MKNIITISFFLVSCFAIGQTPELVFDPSPWGGKPSVEELTEMNGTLYFTANNGNYDYQVWRSDGTSSGTYKVTTSLNDRPTNFTVVGNQLYFRARDDSNNVRKVWITDGTEGGAHVVKHFNPDHTQHWYDAIAFKDKLFFSQVTATYGAELWKTDGTEQGTQLVKDINPDTADAWPFNFIVHNDSLYFSADDGVNGKELWKSDGTTPGTVMVKDINPGSSASYPNNFATIGNTLLFTAYDGVHGCEPWKTDGTAAGTKLIKDLRPGPESSYPDGYACLNGVCCFSASDYSILTNNNHDWEYNTELYRTDGTSSGTYLLKEICEYPYEGSGTGYLTQCGNWIFFTAGEYGIYDKELWKTDGTKVGTKMVRDIVPGREGSSPWSLKCICNILYFNANDGVYDSEPWLSDGTEIGTYIIADLDPEPGSGSSPRYFTQVENKAFFTTKYNGELWKMDVPCESEYPAGLFQVFPNPALDVVQVRINEEFTSATITMYSIFGSIVGHEEVYDNEIKTLDLSNLSSGVYVVKAAFNGQHSCLKLMKYNQ